MILKKHLTKVVTICIFAGGAILPIQADYYLDTLFPIGLTGINPTGGNCPYYSAGWRWQWSQEYPNSEDSLIFSLGINCIGCQDANPTYLIDWKPTDRSSDNEDNYLYQVCKNASGNNPVYVITAGYYVENPRVYMCGEVGDTLNETVDCDTYSYDWIDGVDDTVITDQWPNQSASSMFRSPYRGSHKGIGAMQFSACDDGSNYNCHGTPKDANWNTFDGDSVWCVVADEAVANFQAYFDNNPADTQYVWGYNLITEDPACARRMNMGYWSGTNDHWHGCWAGVDYIFTGHTGSSAFLGDFPAADSHSGIRGAESSLNMENRMFIAKFNPACLHKKGYNIFQWLPDLDAIVAFWHNWCRTCFNYGEQGLFDQLLYATKSMEESQYVAKLGYHNTAIYMQQYGNTYLARSDQKRRWIPWIALEWVNCGTDGQKALCRRPCPPEVRCAAYLLMSRGAKGILFHGWSFTIDTDLWPGSSIEIPYTGSADTTGNVGIRDHYGYPFGDTNSPAYDDYHYLNAGAPDALYWDEARDTTYYYLAHSLIPEIKLLAPILMQLDWVNGYSLNSTDPNWTSPCPHDYVMEVAGVSYMDLGLFDHPYEPVGVEYFMLVNREGIADMTNRTVTVALDAGHWPEEDTLILTDIANLDRPRRLSREGDRFTFTEVFEPGEGKLYRAAPKNEAPVTFLNR